MSQGGLTSANLWTGGSTVVKKHSHTFPAPTNSHARTHMLILADAHARTRQKERHCKLTRLMICACTHVARGDFSITASAKQSPERDVPCLSGKAFQPRFFFFKSVPVPVVRQLSGTQSEMTFNKAANISTVKLHGKRWKKACFKKAKFAATVECVKRKKGGGRGLIKKT